MRTKDLESKIRKQREFLSSHKPGEMLFCRDKASYWLSEPLKAQLASTTVEKVCKRPEKIDQIVDEEVRKFRAQLSEIADLDDDTIPTVQIHFGAGTMTAPMHNGEVKWYGTDTSWVDNPIRTRDDLDKLVFDPDNIWAPLKTREEFTLR